MKDQVYDVAVLGGGDLSVFVTRPICATLLVLASAVLVGPYVLRRWLPATAAT